MIRLDAKAKKIALIIASVILVTIIIGLIFGNNSKSEKPNANRIRVTTTTTLPPANSQACLFFEREILLAGGIVPDDKPKASKDLKRCTYIDLSDGINYLTLFLGKPSQCDVLKADATDPEEISFLGKNAYYFEVIDPTIIVKMQERCYFIQGSKTLIDKTQLTNMAHAVYALFKSVDATTTTTTVPLDPNASTTTLLIPGQNTVVVTTQPESITTKS